MKRIDPRRAVSIAYVLESLPGTKSEVVQRSGLNRSTVYQIIIELHGEQIHIGDWRPHPTGRGPSVPVIVLGGGEDVPDRLPRLTRKQSQDRYLRKIRGTERHDVLKAKWRSRHWIKKAAATPQNPFSALFMGGRHA